MTENTKPQTISIYADTEILQQLNARVGHGAKPAHAAKEGIERYFALLARERRVLLDGLFSTNELALMCDAGNGTMYEAETMHYFAAGLEDAIELDGLAEKWDVDAASLLDRVRGLAPGAIFALVDVIERWWAATSRGESISHDVEGFARLGIGIAEGKQ